MGGRSPLVARLSLRTRLLAALVAVALVAAGGLSYYFLTQIEGYALRKLEERLDTEARVVAAMVSAQASGPNAPKLDAAYAKQIDAALTQAGPTIASLVRVLDDSGRLVASSDASLKIGGSYAERPEVIAALAGHRGATTRVLEDQRVALYIAAPIRAGGTVIGVAYTSSTTFSILVLLRAYRVKLALIVLAYLAVMVLLAEVLSRLFTRPLAELEHAAAAFAAGDYSVRARPSGPREIRAVADAFNAMAARTGTVVGELRSEERAKSRFVSDVSHELRTPLTAIRGAAETLLDSDVEEQDRTRFLGSIMSESDRLARLANDLLTLQRIEGATGEIPLSRVDLFAIASRAVGALAPLLEERGVTAEVVGEAPVVLGDRDRLQQVLANLVDNGSRMTPAGGHVTVALGRDGAWAVVSVTDEGPGIADEDLPHVFERFYRAQLSRSRATGGAGLGLSIVAAIVGAHAGSVSVENTAASGARFIVRLPALELPPTDEDAS